MSGEELQKIRGKEIAMIFQDPFACLHPMYRVGDQIVEAVRVHDHGLEVRGRASAPSSCSRQVGIPNGRGSASATTRTSTRAACASAR